MVLKKGANEGNKFVYEHPFENAIDFVDDCAAGKTMEGYLHEVTRGAESVEWERSSGME